jgi:hypothetical protein
LSKFEEFFEFGGSQAIKPISTHGIAQNIEKNKTKGKRNANSRFVCSCFFTFDRIKK